MTNIQNLSKRALVKLMEAGVFWLGLLSPVHAQLGGIDEGALEGRTEDQPENLFGQGGVFQKITNTIIFLVGAIAVIMLIVGGVRYVVSAGSDEAVKGAKNTILYAIVGIVVALLAYAAVNFIIGQIAVTT